MNAKELRDLIDYVVEKDLAEFEFVRGDLKVRIARGSATVQYAPVAPVAAMAPVVTAAPVSGPAVQHAPVGSPQPRPAEAETGVHLITSPIVGTYYEAPSPGAPPFVKPGDQVAAGQVLCIIEAMKLMNEIESDVAGEVVKLLVKNGEPVEYGQQLFAIKPRG